MQTRKLEQGLLSHGAICRGPQPAPLVGDGGYDVIGGVCDDGDGAADGDGVDDGVGDDDIDDGDADSSNTLSCSILGARYLAHQTSFLKPLTRKQVSFLVSRHTVPPFGLAHSNLSGVYICFTETSA